MKYKIVRTEDGEISGAVNNDTSEKLGSLYEAMLYGVELDWPDKPVAFGIWVKTNILITDIMIQCGIDEICIDGKELAKNADHIRGIYSGIQDDGTIIFKLDIKRVQ